MIRVIKRLVCDVCHALYWREFDNKETFATEVREAAVAEGWLNEGTVDLCPMCRWLRNEEAAMPQEGDAR